jgi:NADH-ubiquinone oxidoreductase chain 1
MVSGFNTEIEPGVLLSFFLAEYTSILFIRLLFCVTFWVCDLDSLLFYIRVTFISYLFIWVRGT